MTLDKSSGSVLTSLVLSGNPGTEALYTGLQFGDGGTLFSSTIFTTQELNSGPSSLFSIDTSTGTVSLIGGVGVASLVGLAYLPSPAAPAAVPEPSSLALLGIGAVFAGAARRRRRGQPGQS